MLAHNKENNPSNGVHAKFAKLISSYAGEDPLAPWLAYKQALDEIKASKDEIATLATKCLQNFRGNPRYAEDTRFVKLCLHIAEATKRDESFEELAQAGIGQRQAVFYWSWARILQARGAHAEAIAMIERGITRCTDAKKLQSALEEVRARARAALGGVPHVAPHVPQVAPSPAPSSNAAKALEQAAYNRALTVGANNIEISFEERRAELHAARAAARAELERRRREEEEAASSGGVANEAVMEEARDFDEEVEGVDIPRPMDDSGITSNLQTGLLTMNSLIAHEEIRQMWHEPINLERKPAIAAPPVAAVKQGLVAQTVAPAPLAAPIQQRAAPLCIYEDPTPMPLQPAAWIQSKISPSIVTSISNIHAPLPGPLPQLQPQAHISLGGDREWGVIEHLHGSAWRADEFIGEEDGPTIAFRSGNRAPLLWYVHISNLLAGAATPPKNLVRPIAFLDHRDTAVVAFPYLAQLTLADVAAYCAKPMEEMVAAAFAVEMILRLEDFHRCGVLHGQLEKLQHWQMAWESSSSEPWRAGGWPGKSLRLLDFTLSIPLADLNSNSIAPPSGHPLASLLPAKWGVHLDYLSLALALHELLFSSPLKYRAALDGSVQADLPVNRPLAADWARVFSMLLSLRSSVPSLPAVRGILESYLQSCGTRVKIQMNRCKLQVVEMKEKETQAHSS